MKGQLILFPQLDNEQAHSQGVGYTAAMVRATADLITYYRFTAARAAQYVHCLSAVYRVPAAQVRNDMQQAAKKMEV